MWGLDYLIHGNCYIKTIINNKKEIILVVDILSDETINKIIEEHNESLSREYKIGLRDGINMMKNGQQN